MPESPLPDLSVIVITHDEEADLPGCLESVRGLAAEIVVVDGGSKDNTADVARRCGARLHMRAFDGYAPQKQFALDQARNAWALSIDADERVTPELAREIRSLLAAKPSAAPDAPIPSGTAAVENGPSAAPDAPIASGTAAVENGPSAAGYEIPFEVEYLGRTLRFGGLGSERHLRLFRRDAARFVGGKIHEGTEVTGAVGRLSGKIRHVPYRDLSEHLEKLNRYTTLMARKRYDEGFRVGPMHMLVPLWEFFTRAVLRLGVLDGGPGLVYAVMASFYTWAKYAKVARLQAGDGA